MSYYYTMVLVCMSTDILFIYMYVLLLHNCISMYEYSQYSQYTSYSSLDIDCLHTVIHMLRYQDVILGYEPAGLTVHPPPQNDRGWVHFFRMGV